MSEGASARFYAILVVIVVATGFGYSIGHINGAAAGNRRLEMEVEKMTTIASRQEKRLANVADAVGIDQDEIAAYASEDFASQALAPARP
jgi:hypothetical protein